MVNQIKFKIKIKNKSSNMWSNTFFVNLFFIIITVFSLFINSILLHTHLAIVCAKIINIYTGVTFILMSKKFTSKIPLYFFKNLYSSDIYVKIHYILLFHIFGLSILHIVAHYYSFITNQTEFHVITDFWSNPSIFTGNILLFISFFIIPGLRLLSRSSVLFIWVHHAFVIGYITILFSHGCFCYLKLNDGSCRNPQSWKWSVIPLCIYLVDLILRYIKKPVKIQQIKVYNKKILQISISKDEQLEKNLSSTIYINCPEISSLEWHPFSIVSSKFDYDDKYTTFYIKDRGDWTNSFHKLVGKINNEQYIPVIYPLIKIDGPYGNNFENIEKILACHNVCIYSLGIGFTPFISIFKYLTNSNCKIKNLLIVLTVRDINDLDMIHNLLLNLKEKYTNIKIYIYETHNTKHTIVFDEYYSTQIKVYHGRPNIQDLKKQEYITKIFKIS